MMFMGQRMPGRSRAGSIRRMALLAASALGAVWCPPGVVQGQTPGHYGYKSSLPSAQLDADLGSKLDADGGVLSHGTSVTPFSFLNAAPALDTRFETGGLTNGNIIAAGGNWISYCPVLQCPRNPTAGHNRTSAVFWATTADDGHSEEQTVSIETIIGTGFAKTWAPGTAFALGDNVRNFADNTVYRVIQAGVSAGGGSGPSGRGLNISDGTIVWAYINDSAIDSKVGLYNEVSVVPGAGNSWAQANNVWLQPGVTPTFNINTELDLTNNAGDCSPRIGGTGNCNVLEMAMAGAFQSTTGIHLSSQNAGPGYATAWGLRMEGHYLASSADIQIDTTDPIGIAFNTFLPGGHSTAAVVDGSTGNAGWIANGTKTASDFQINSNSPIAFANGGVHAAGTFVDNSNSPIGASFSGTREFETINDTSVTKGGINLAGDYSIAAVATLNARTPNALLAADGQKICFNSTDACFVHSAALGKLYYQVDGVSLFSIADGSGNMVTKGTLTQNGTP